MERSMVKNIPNYRNLLVSVKVKDIAFLILNYKALLFVAIHIFLLYKETYFALKLIRK